MTGLQVVRSDGYGFNSRGVQRKFPASVGTFPGLSSITFEIALKAKRKWQTRDEVPGVAAGEETSLDRE